MAALGREQGPIAASNALFVSLDLSFGRSTWRRNLSS